jgi:diketogulonate reductase-like aldo/keto reductase
MDALFKNGQANPVWLKKLEAVRDIHTSEGRTLAQGALAWLWGRSKRTLPIPGFRTIAQVEENCAALHFLFKLRSIGINDRYVNLECIGNLASRAATPDQVQHFQFAIS